MAEYAGSMLTTPWADVEQDADGLIAKGFVNPLPLIVGDEMFCRALVIPVNMLSPTQVTLDVAKGRPGCWWIGKGVGYCCLQRQVLKGGKLLKMSLSIVRIGPA